MENVSNYTLTKQGISIVTLIKTFQSQNIYFHMIKKWHSHDLNDIST